MGDQCGPRQRTRVVLAVPDLSTGGGVNRVATDLSRLLAEDVGCDVTLLSARANKPPTYAVPEGVRLERAESDGAWLHSYFRRLLGLRRRRFDYAVGFWTQDNVLLLIALLFSRTRVVLCEHGSHFARPWPVRLVRRLVYPFAWRVAVLNNAEFSHYRRWLKNVRLVPNPVPPVSQIGCGKQKLVIAVGHLIPLKGFVDLVEAWVRSDLVEMGWKLAIIGDGPQRAAIERRIRDRQARGVELVPPTRDIREWYSRARILVSTANVEVFSMVIAEAVRDGAVPIAYAADGPAYLLEEVSELLVRTGDVEGLASKMRWAADGADLRVLQEAVARSIERRMPYAQVVEKWREILQPQSRCGAAEAAA